MIDGIYSMTFRGAVSWGTGLLVLRRGIVTGAETPVDVTLVYDVGWDTQAFLQTFNVITEGGGQPPFTYYRYHKLALSAVHPLWGVFSVQLGAFISPARQNALREQGVFTAVWTRF